MCTEHLEAGECSAMVYALRVTDGRVLPGWPVDVQAALGKRGLTFISKNQNQRGALTTLKGIVYIPYGGLNGDCADYRGWVVGINMAHPTQVRAFKTAAPNRGGVQKGPNMSFETAKA